MEFFLNNSKEHHTLINKNESMISKEDTLNFINKDQMQSINSLDELEELELPDEDEFEYYSITTSESYLSQENKNLQIQITELKEYISYLENNNTNLNKEKSTLEKEYNYLLINHKLSKVNNSSLQKTNQDLQIEINKLRTSINEFLSIDNLIADKITLDKRIEELTKKNIELENTVSRLENINNSLYEENKNIKEYKKYKSAFELLIDDITSNCYKKKTKKSKEKELDIIEILRLRKEGKSYRKIAKEFNVSPSTILYRINKAQK